MHTTREQIVPVVFECSTLFRTTLLICHRLHSSMYNLFEYGPTVYTEYQIGFAVLKYY